MCVFLYLAIQREHRRRGEAHVHVPFAIEWRRLRELVKRLDPVSMQPHHDYVLVGRRDALSRDFATMLDDLRMAFAKPARHTHKGRGSKSSPTTDGLKPGPAPATSRKPD